MSRIGRSIVKEMERVSVIEAHANGEIKSSVAAFRLQMSMRQIKRLLERFKQDGAGGLVSGHRGRPSNNVLDPEVALDALKLVKEHYADFGPTLACEALADRHQVFLSKETLRKLMIEAGIWKTRDTRLPRLHQPRERRPCFGELIQIDGSRHAWFEGRAGTCTLLVFIDDATSKIVRLHFAQTETTTSYFEAMHGYLQQYGKPQAFYADRAAVFRSPAANQHTPTQFQRALNELDISLICANSPQAKGRVERVNRTLQDRLVKALRLDGISSIEAANAWAKGFVESHNRRFVRAPRSNLDQHTPLRANENLERILSHQETRMLSTKLTLTHVRRQYVLKDDAGVRELIGKPVTIHTYSDGRTELLAGSKVLAFSVIDLHDRTRQLNADSKGLHQQVDQIVAKTSRPPRPCRKNQPTALVASGVREAKKTSASKRNGTL